MNTEQENPFGNKTAYDGPGSFEGYLKRVTSTPPSFGWGGLDNTDPELPKLVTNWDKRTEIDRENGSAWPKAADMRRDLISAGYKTIWQRSDGSIVPSKKPMTAGDNVRRRGELSAMRIDLASKRDSAGAIADAIRGGHPIGGIRIT